jgi:hypothetical protein
MRLRCLPRSSLDWADWSSQDALGDTTQGRAFMNRLIIPALLAATGVVVGDETVPFPHSVK